MKEIPSVMVRCHPLAFLSSSILRPSAPFAKWTSFGFLVDSRRATGLQSPRRPRHPHIRSGSCTMSNGSVPSPSPVSDGSSAPSIAAESTSGVDKNAPSTEDVFAADAGRDLFFAGMDETLAISILDAPFGAVTDIEDRYIAAERLKFFASSASAEALMRFVSRFDTSCMDSYILEDRVARRKAVESLGRQKGAALPDAVVAFLTDCLCDNDDYIVENAVWSLGEIGRPLSEEAAQRVMMALDRPGVARRIVIQALLRARYMPAVPRLRKMISDDECDNVTMSAARAAVSTLAGDDSVMERVVDILRSDNLNERRSAIEDVKLALYVDGMEHVAVCPNSLVLRARAVRALLDRRREAAIENGIKEEDYEMDDKTARLVDRLIWDHPCDLDLLGMKKETKKSRNMDRNIKQLYKNDALYCYLGCRTLAEDHRDSDSNDVAGAAVLKSYNDLDYFDYFGAYHAYKTLGWLRHRNAFELLERMASTLPPRFFNHKVGAITALAELGEQQALHVIESVAQESSIWEVKYACVVAAERLNDGGRVRNTLRNDSDWVVNTRCRNMIGFDHLRSSFS